MSRGCPTVPEVPARTPFHNYERLLRILPIGTQRGRAEVIEHGLSPRAARLRGGARLNTVPAPWLLLPRLAPPNDVVPYKLPEASRITPAEGSNPSGQENTGEQGKLYRIP